MSLQSLSWVPLVGGVALGFCSVAKLLLTGRILGISGALSGLLTNKEGKPWRTCFLGGLLGGGVLVRLCCPKYFYALPATYSVARLSVAGLLVGSGTTIGNGCTSGHGISGLSRLSVRSLVSVLTFMGTGFLTATLLRSSEAVSNPAASAGVPSGQAECHALLLLAVTAVPTLAAAVVALWQRQHQHQPHPTATSTVAKPPFALPLDRAEKVGRVVEVLTGAAFAAGLAVTGMLSPFKVTRFLDLSNLRTWDPSLMLVMGGAIAATLPLFQLLVLRRAKEGKAPLLGGRFDLPKRVTVDGNLVLGGALFGVGWGLAGMCPGPAIVSLVQPPLKAREVVYLPAAIFNACMGLGMVASSYAIGKCY